MKTLLTAWDAQFLTRYHTAPMQMERQTVGAHSYAVSILIDQLWPDSSKQLIMAALYHDVPEIILGDIPATAKWDYPELHQAFERAEKKVMDDLGLNFVLTAEEKNRLKMADMLELVMYCHRHDMQLILHCGLNYLHKHYGQMQDFVKVEEVLIHLGLGVK